MKKQRVSFSACFLGKSKEFIFVGGGFGAGRRVLEDTEVFNLNENFWTVFPPMIEPRASHSMILSENLSWVYVFGGLNTENVAISSIERLRISLPSEPLKDMKG